MFNKKYNLTNGNILAQLIKVSLPVMLTSLMQMAYNLTDLFWLGRATSDDAVNTGYIASAGIGGLFTWLSAAIIILVRIGTEVRVAQAVGRVDETSARDYARTGVQLEVILGLLFTFVIASFTPFWISLFDIPEQEVYHNAVIYLRIISSGLIFYMLNPVFSATLNGTGNTKTSFLISSIGLTINMLLDPLLIIVFKMGIEGAAIATVIAQITVTVAFLLYFHFNESLLRKASYFTKFDKDKALDILKLGFPAAIQSAIFTFISMYITGLVSPFGKEANAVQKLGSQIESLSWLVAGGFQTALAAFVGQNYGAKQPKRILDGFRYAMLTLGLYGIVISVLMFVFSKELFQLFSHDPGTVSRGDEYLKILAFSQLFMIIEALVGGAFNGLGKTIPQSIVSLSFNALRIPMAYFFIEYYGLNGIWLALTISSIFKGTVIYLWFKIYIRNKEIFRLALKEG